MAFECNRKSCELRCCDSFNTVFFSNKSYKALKESRNSDLRRLTRSFILKNEEAITEFDAYIMESGGKCPMLCEDGSCLVENVFGAKFMGYPCGSYPGFVRQVGPYYEEGVSLACPLVAKTVLSQKSGLNFINMQRDVSKDLPARRYTDIRNVYGNYIQDVKDIGLNILKKRTLEIDVRLFVLTIFYSHLEQLFTNCDAQTSVFVGLYKDKLADDELRSLLDGYECNLKEQLVLYYLFGRPLLTSENNDQIDELLDFAYKFAEGVKMSEMDEFADKYRKAREQIYQPFMDEHGYILENFLVNEFFNDALPFLYFKDMQDATLYFVVYFGMLEFMICAMALRDEKIDVPDVYQLIIRLAKRFEPVSQHFENKYEGRITKDKFKIILGSLENFKLKHLQVILGLLGKTAKKPEGEEEKKDGEKGK
ncbi:MAG: flagellin lysine-N-methylase [Oscillospiraceae bacterium]|nr:flagellin lysine-N-methylase [Oscillospiraceae bacterium]